MKWKDVKSVVAEARKGSCVKEIKMDGKIPNKLKHKLKGVPHEITYHVIGTEYVFYLQIDYRKKEDLTQWQR